MTRRPQGRRQILAVAVAAVLSLIAGMPLTAAAAERRTDDAATADVRPTSGAAGEVRAGEIAAEDPVPPAPVPPAPVEEADALPPAPLEEAEAPPPAPAPAPADEEPDPCAKARSWVADAGLVLPPGVGYHCPSTRFAHHGAACWNADPCRGTAFIAINLDLMGSPTSEYLRHVVAHEVCHILDFQGKGWTTEPGADACAAAHGA